MPDFTPAKRGDLACIRQDHSTTYAFGSGRGTERHSTYALAVVTSITRGGMVARAERPSPHGPWTDTILPKIGSVSVVRADRFGARVTDIVSDLARDFASLEEARKALRPYLKA